MSPTGELVAITGGGGKTSLLFALGASLSGRVILTTTTRVFAAQMKLAPAAVALGPEGKVPDVLLRRHLEQQGQCMLVGRIRGEKALGVPPDLPGQLLDKDWVDHLLVEADGSRMRPCKAPAAHEPVIPPDATLVVPVAGIDAVGRPLNVVAHRPELVADLTGLLVEEMMTVKALATLMSHDNGGLKNVPDGARVIPLLNKVETTERLAIARQVALFLLQNERIDSVVLGAVKEEPPVREVHSRVTAVVLAAGSGSRMGEAKQLMRWGDRTILGQTLDNLSRSPVFECLVVTGHRRQEVAAIAVDYGSQVVHNPDYETGEMLSSLQAAVRVLPASREAVLVVLADQPMVGPEVIVPLLEAFWRKEGDLIAPVYRGKRGNPVLIGRDYFRDLLSLPAGGAPRLLLQRYAGRLHLVEVGTDAVLRDIDTLEEYRQERMKREREGD